MSWWIHLDRQAFNRELEIRFALNKPDTPRRGLPKVMTKEQASRGGKAKRSSYLSHEELWERKKRTA